MSDTKGKADSPGPDPAGNPPIDVAHGTGSPAAAQGVDFERWYGLATKFVAPATFLTAVLFYYGYVSSRAQYRYFGLDVDTIGLSTRDYVMRSPQPLLVPLLLVSVIGAGLLAIARVLQRRIPLRMLRAATWASTLVLGVGVLMLFGYSWIGEWPYYPMVTPLVLAAGLLALVWCWRRAGGRRTAVALALIAVAVCVFWATATLAQWTGLGTAQRTARNLDQLPAVVMDTRERLYLGTTPDSGVTETNVGGLAVADEDQSVQVPLPGTAAPHPVRRPDVLGSRALDAQQLHPSGADRHRPSAVPVRQRRTGVTSVDRSFTRVSARPRGLTVTLPDLLVEASHGTSVRTHCGTPRSPPPVSAPGGRT